MKQKSLRLLVLAMAFGTMQWQPAYADPVDVSYTVSGSPGAWVLDFSVTNNLGGTNSIYYLNVGLPTTSIVGSPAGWATARPIIHGQMRPTVDHRSSITTLGEFPVIHQ